MIAKRGEEPINMHLLFLKQRILEKYRETEPDHEALDRERPPFCNFCGKSSSEVAGMVQGPQIHMCNECVAVAYEILSPPARPKD